VPSQLPHDCAPGAANRPPQVGVCVRACAHGSDPRPALTLTEHARKAISWLFATFAILPLLACAGGDLQQPRNAGEAAATESEPAAALRQLNWAWNCEDGRYVVGSYRGDDLWLFLPGETVKLTRDPSASGARYSNRLVTFWSKGEEAMLETPAGRSDCALDRTASVWEDAKLRGADFRAVGNEPGWHLELFSDGPSLLVSDYGELRLRFEAAGPLPMKPGPGSIYTGRADGRDVVILLTPGPCQDTMVEESYETRVRVLLDQRVLIGCGRALH
jgi:membrane-bound inhibitor of C-type lysozyme